MVLDEIDARDRNYIINKIAIDRKVEKLKMISDIAEAVRRGNAAIQSDDNASAYRDWQHRIDRDIRRLRGEKILTVWDIMKGRSGKV